MGCLQRRAELCDDWDCWLCVHCTRNLFPFAEADDEYICKEPLKKIEPDQFGSADANCELVVFPDESENRVLINNNDVDPDQNYFTNLAWNSPYRGRP